jgi:hypothetical protein
MKLRWQNCCEHVDEIKKMVSFVNVMGERALFENVVNEQ